MFDIFFIVEPWTARNLPLIRQQYKKLFEPFEFTVVEEFNYDNSEFLT